MCYFCWTRIIILAVVFVLSLLTMQMGTGVDLHLCSLCGVRCIQKGSFVRRCEDGLGTDGHLPIWDDMLLKYVDFSWSWSWSWRALVSAAKISWVYPRLIPIHSSTYTLHGRSFSSSTHAIFPTRWNLQRSFPIPWGLQCDSESPYRIVSDIWVAESR